MPKPVHSPRSRAVNASRHRRRAWASRRDRLPAVPAARPPPGPLLGRGRPRRRPRALALRPPRRPRHAGEVHRRGDGGAWRPARHHPPPHGRADASRGARRGPAPSSALPAAPAAGEGGAYDATEAARRLWRRCRAIDGTHAEKYLQARGLARCRFAALRFHPELRYREGSSVRRLPALVAAVTGDAGERPGHGAILGVQRTWLDPRSPAKAGVASPPQGARAHLWPRGSLRAPRRRRFAPRRRGHRGRCSRSSPPCRRSPRPPHSPPGSLGAFAPPPGVVRLVIARDNDVEGEQAAERLARRCARAGVARLRPRAPGRGLQRRPPRPRRSRARRRASRRCSASREEEGSRAEGRPAGRKGGRRCPPS